MRIPEWPPRMLRRHIHNQMQPLGAFEHQKHFTRLSHIHQIISITTPRRSLIHQLNSDDAMIHRLDPKVDRRSIEQVSTIQIGALLTKQPHKCKITFNHRPMLAPQANMVDPLNIIHIIMQPQQHSPMVPVLNQPQKLQNLHFPRPSQLSPLNL
jgi:hypothetical protein